MTTQTRCNDCGAAIFDQRYLKCGACLARIGVVPLTSPVPPVIDWKAVAHHQRHLRKLSEALEITLKRRLGQEHERRAMLVNTMADILMDIAYDSESDPDQDYCNVCRRHLPEEDGHRPGCLYVLALAALMDAGKSVEDRISPTAITFTCHECGEYFDEPMEAFIATASVAVLAPTLCKGCGHGEED